MGVHEKIRREDLKVEVFKSVTENHRLELCPKCGEGVERPTCFSGREDLQYGAPGSGSAKVICHKCSIVWELQLFNWTNENGDGTIRGEGHRITLLAFANCFCRRSLIDHHPASIHIHEGVDHSRLDSPCGSTRSQRGTVVMKNLEY